MKDVEVIIQHRRKLSMNIYKKVEKFYCKGNTGQNLYSGHQFLFRNFEHYT